MKTNKIINIIHSSMSCQSAKSSGSGGQKINKKNIKVQVTFSIAKSTLSQWDKDLLLEQYPSGYISASSSSTRYLSKNKDDAILKIAHKVEEGIRVIEKRKNTSKDYKTIQREQKNRRKHSEKKTQRKKMQRNTLI